MALTPQGKIVAQKRMRDFIEFCHSIGYRDDDLITIKAVHLSGDAEIKLDLGDLKHLVSMED